MSILNNHLYGTIEYYESEVELARGRYEMLTYAAVKKAVEAAEVFKGLSYPEDAMEHMANCFAQVVDAREEYSRAQKAFAREYRKAKEKEEEKEKKEAIND